ncbi:MAG: ribbon-helix-helix domain-containing protein [Actinomycetota bacterium]|nr:ribbon-helix-helix domain-containing protein [Actinomycetota bacterium]
MAKDHGKLKDGTAVGDDVVERLADEAEKGYDVDEIQRRKAGGRPAMGSGPASVESVRLDPELKKQLLLRASKDGISVSELIRKALRTYVRAS